MAESQKIPPRKPCDVPQMTPEEYLHYEELQQARHEYVSGQVFAISGSTEAHNIICMNLASLIHAYLRGTGCHTYANDMKARIEAADCFYYPDIMVSCEPFDAKSVFKKQPCLIVEILSPSTKHIDRREKLVAYRHLESLREYLIISQDRPKIEYFKKDDSGKWVVTILGKDDTVVFTSLPKRLEVSVERIYEDIPFTPMVQDEDDECQYVTA